MANAAVTKRSARVPFAVLLLSLIAGTMALLLALNTASAANEVNRHDAALADEQLNAQIVALQNQIASSAAPENIANVARGLGMVPAGNPAFLRIDVDGSVKLLGSAAPATAPFTPPPSTPKPTPTPTATTSAAATATATAITSAAATTTPVAPTTPAAPPPPPPTPTDTPTESLPGGAR
ncbi:MAG TPA: hypothetical protein VGL26_03720 [Jatrophihabitans sp.]